MSDKLTAADALRKWQKQCDPEGIEVQVSRQALDEVLDALEAMQKDRTDLIDNETGERVHPDSTITIPIYLYQEKLDRIAELERGWESIESEEDAEMRRLDAEKSARIAELESALKHTAACNNERLRLAALHCQTCDELSKQALKGEGDE